MKERKKIFAKLWILDFFSFSSFYIFFFFFFSYFFSLLLNNNFDNNFKQQLKENMDWNFFFIQLRNFRSHEAGKLQQIAKQADVTPADKNTINALTQQYV